MINGAHEDCSDTDVHGPLTPNTDGSTISLHDRSKGSPGSNCCRNMIVELKSVRNFRLHCADYNCNNRFGNAAPIVRMHADHAVGVGSVTVDCGTQDMTWDFADLNGNTWYQNCPCKCQT